MLLRICHSICNEFLFVYVYHDRYNSIIFQIISAVEGS